MAALHSTRAWLITFGVCLRLAAYLLLCVCCVYVLVRVCLSQGSKVCIITLFLFVLVSFCSERQEERKQSVQRKRLAESLGTSSSSCPAQGSHTFYHKFSACTDIHPVKQLSNMRNNKLTLRLFSKTHPPYFSKHFTEVMCGSMRQGPMSNTGSQTFVLRASLLTNLRMQNVFPHPVGRNVAHKPLGYPLHWCDQADQQTGWHMVNIPTSSFCGWTCHAWNCWLSLMAVECLQWRQVLLLLRLMTTYSRTLRPQFQWNASRWWSMCGIWLYLVWLWDHALETVLKNIR